MSQRSWNEVADTATIDRTMAALQERGITVQLVASGAQAKAAVLERLPAGAEVMNMTSVTLETLGIVDEVLHSGRYTPVREKFKTLLEPAQAQEKKRLGAAPAWVIGSVHAVTEAGEVLIASNTGSQLPAYAYGAGQVVWVVGAQKIVPDVASGMRRIYEHCLPLEAERARQAYGSEGSQVSKVLLVNNEVEPNRITMILVNEVLGF